jgi:MIP family channel proteins
MDPKLRSYLAELVGTFALVFAGAGTVCAAALTTEPRLGVVDIALAEGLTLAVVLTATSLVSEGYLNPAVTLTLWVFKRLGGAQAAVMIAMQLLGAVLAGLAVLGLFGRELPEAHLGTPHLKTFFGPNHEVTYGSLFSGIAVELCLTFLVTLAVFATLIDRRGPRLGGLVVGLAQAAAVLFGFRLTGGAANPARWLGPWVWQLTVQPPPAGGHFADHPVYWVGPVVGALLAGIFYTGLVMLPREK